MNALFSPIYPLASAIADLILGMQSRLRRFLTSDNVPTWTEYMGGCNKN